MGCLICGSGDVAAQKLLSTQDNVDAPRLKAMASYGLLAAVPYHYWYRWLAARFPVAIGTKTALECLIIVPCFEIPAITLYTGVLGRNQTLGDAITQLVDDFWPACIYGFALWAPTSVFTFSLVPPRWHLTSFYLAGALWDFGISYLAFDKHSYS